MFMILSLHYSYMYLLYVYLGCDVENNNLYLFALQQILMSHVKFMFIHLSLAKRKVGIKVFY